jgi:hypothetical protein
MLIEYIDFRVPHDGWIAVERCCANAALSLDGSLFCRAYELACSSDDPLAGSLRIEWTSREDRRIFRHSGEFSDFAASLAPLAELVSATRFHETTAVAHRR